MEVKAMHRFAGVSPSKVRLVLEHLPGKSIGDALGTLQFMVSPHARLVAKIVKSAAADPLATRIRGAPRPLRLRTPHPRMVPGAEP